MTFYKGKETERKDEFLELGKDYYSYALFAFYLFDEHDKQMMRSSTSRFSEKMLESHIRTDSGNKSFLDHKTRK